MGASIWAAYFEIHNSLCAGALLSHTCSKLLASINDFLRYGNIIIVINELSILAIIPYSVPTSFSMIMGSFACTNSPITKLDCIEAMHALLGEASLVA